MLSRQYLKLLCLAICTKSPKMVEKVGFEPILVAF